MTKSIGPFDAGAGASMTENNWRKMAQMFAETGVLDGYLNELAVFGDSTGMHVKIPSGLAYVKGHFFESDAQETVTIAANASGNPRIDRVVLEANFTTNVIDYVVVAGTPAGSPAAPALTQNLTAKWQMPLAQVAVANGASTIAAGNVTDERNLLTTQPFAPQSDYVAAAESTSSSVYDDLATVGPQVTVPIGPRGAAIVSIGADLGVGFTGAINVRASVALTGANTAVADDAHALRVLSSAVLIEISASRVVFFSGLTPGLTTFTMKYKADDPDNIFVWRYLTVIPI